MDVHDATISINLEGYRKLVNYYNCNRFNKRKDYVTLVIILRKLKNIIRRIERLYYSGELPFFEHHIIALVLVMIPREFTAFGILVNTGEWAFIKRLFNPHIIPLINDTPSKYVVMNPKLRKIEKIGMAPPIMIAYRNGDMQTVGLLAHSKAGDVELLIQEFHEPLLSKNPSVKELKIYDFIRKHFSSYRQPYGMYCGKNTIEKTVTFTFKIGYFELFKYFVKLESEKSLCDSYVWRKLVYHSINNDDIKVFCYFVQVGLYIDKFHLKNLVRNNSTKIGLHRNSILELVYLSGVHVKLEQLLRFSDTLMHNDLKYYSHNAPSLLNYCRMSLRMYFRDILPHSCSIFKIIDNLDHIPNPLKVFLRMDDFVEKLLEF